MYTSPQSSGSQVSGLPVYRKALEIFGLSRSLTHDLTEGATVLEMYREQGIIHQYSDQLVMASLGLAPKIALAESASDFKVRLRSVRAVKKATAALIRYCDLLEAQHQYRKDYLRRFRIELYKFRRLQRDWANRVVGAN